MSITLRKITDAYVTCPCCGYYQIVHPRMALRCHECDAALPICR